MSIHIEPIATIVNELKMERFTTS